MEMENHRKEDDELLQLIPNERLSSKQKAFRPATVRPERYEKGLPMYKLLGELQHLDDVDWTKYRNIALWRENETIISVCEFQFEHYTKERTVCFTLDFGDYKLECAIYGKSDAAIAKTLTFFLSLSRSGESKGRTKVCISSHRGENHFDFAALEVKQLVQILDMNPTRQYNFETGTWNAQQCVILATRPYPLHLTFSGRYDGGAKFTFKDGGAAFVNALAKRQSSFGSFSINFNMGEVPFSDANLARLLQLEVFEELFSYCLDGECFFLPFFTKVKTLQYRIEAAYLRSNNFDWLDIATKDLCLAIYLDGVDEPEQLLTSFLSRVAEIGHFEKLSFAADIVYDGYREFDNLALVVEALIDVINRNPNLTFLDLSYTHWCLDWALHFPSIFKAMENHPGLRTFKVKKFAPNYDLADDDSEVSAVNEPEPDYSCLELLLSRNRNITVLDDSDKRITNGSTIDKLYSLNRLYHGSMDMVKDATSLRPLLVATALVESASENFPSTALLLADHMGTLCEFMHGANGDEFDISQSAPEEEALFPFILPA